MKRSEYVTRVGVCSWSIMLGLAVLISACSSAAPRSDVSAISPDMALDSGALDRGATPGDGAHDVVPADVARDATPTDGGLHAEGGDLAPTTQSGVLLAGTGPLPGPIAGVSYTSGSISGVTDAQGLFNYKTGATIVFQVADMTFRPTMGASKLSPFQLAGSGACVFGPELEKVLVLLYSLDADGDPSTGTTLTAFPITTPLRAVAHLSLAEVDAAVTHLMPGTTPLTAAEALDRFVRQIDDEAWTEKTLDAFLWKTALSRGQGIASDGTDWFFSGTLSLERTDAKFSTKKLNAIAIPPALLLQGSDHIGDIDVYNGTLYAPIEDKKAVHPMLVLYDAATLTAGQEYEVPQALQTHGVPWVTVNGPAGEVYFAEWSPTKQLNIFSLSNIAYLRSLKLVWPPKQAKLGRIQGAKVFEGALYMASDETEKTIYKVNLDTGTVMRLFTLPVTTEQEGLAFVTRPDGTQLHTLNVNALFTGVEVRHHTRTRLPLRKAICP